MKRFPLAIGVLLTLWAGLFSVTTTTTSAGQPAAADDLIESGRQIFRYDTFGDEQLWTNVLRMNEAVHHVSPATALAVGLKVDVDQLPRGVLDAIANGQVNLNDPAVTRTLLKLNAVVGLVGTVDDNDRITSLGVTCALCHSTVDDSFAPGVGRRLDGWPNLSLNVGAIVGLSPPYFHDGSAPDLMSVVNHYDRQFRLNLTPAQKADLVEFLKSL